MSFALIASGQFQPEVVTTNVASFDDAPTALHDHCRGNALKTILIAD
jgi:alcohol dehydrogenase